MHKKLDRNINKSINLAIKKNKSGYIWEKTIGITLEELKEHLEKNFKDYMNWGNYGVEWIIGKVIPTSAYRYGNVKGNEFKKAWSLKNFIPISKSEHSKQNGKIIIELISTYNLFDILPSGMIQFEGKINEVDL